MLNKSPQIEKNIIRILLYKNNIIYILLYKKLKYYYVIDHYAMKRISQFQSIYYTCHFVVNTVQWYVNYVSFIGTQSLYLSTCKLYEKIGQRAYSLCIAMITCMYGLQSSFLINLFFVRLSAMYRFITHIELYIAYEIFIPMKEAINIFFHLL